MSDPAERPNRRPWPPMIYGAAVLAAVLLGIFFPLRLGWPAWEIRFAAGAALVVAAVAVEIWAARTLRSGETTIMPHRRSSHLVTGGPFAWSRNPIYLGNTVLMTGVGLMAGSFWFILLALVAAVLVTELAIRREERHLSALFGEDYERYRKRVRRWL
jgi:protein-S-isoprenylcysteine O-methyltransferase Ste14